MIFDGLSHLPIQSVSANLAGCLIPSRCQVGLFHGVVPLGLHLFRGVCLSVAKLGHLWVIGRRLKRWLSLLTHATTEWLLSGQH